MLFILSIFMLGHASIEDILSAKNSEQVLKLSRQSEETSTLRQRCEAELRGKFFPLNCWRWYQKANMSPRQRVYFKKTFDLACSQALAFKSSTSQFHLAALKEVRGVCQLELAKAAEKWLYKVQKEGEAEIFRHFKVGNEFEIALGDETLEVQKSNRAKTSRAVRRRLN